MAGLDGHDGLLSMEVFAAKDLDGQIVDLFVSVPRLCGLKHADTLLVDGLTIIAMQARTMLPLDMADLSTEAREKLAFWARSGHRLAVAEFTALGLLDAYFLGLTVI